MPEPVIRWLETAPWTVLLLAFLVENVGIRTGRIILGFTR